jgi:hypothetical protein
MSTIIISSQRYLDETIVEEKRNNEDYNVTVSPAFEVDGINYQIVMDGHHSLAAAKLDGIEPEYTIATLQTSDAIALLEDNKIEDFLEVQYIDSSYYEVENGEEVWQ